MDIFNINSQTARKQKPSPFHSLYIALQLYFIIFNSITMVSTRAKIISDLKNIPKFLKTENWNVSEGRYKSGNGGISYLHVTLETNSKGEKRYILASESESDSDSDSESDGENLFTMDDVLLISMIILSFYRFQFNIGRKAASTLLSTSYSEISSKQLKDLFGNKLENLWKDEMESLFSDESNQFTEKTTKEPDNYFMFFNFYPKPIEGQEIWDRYAFTKTGERAAKFYLHEYANNGVIQLAKHLVDIDYHYLDLANVLMVYIEDNEWSEMVDTIAEHLKEGPEAVLKKLNYF